MGIVEEPPSHSQMGRLLAQALELADEVVFITDRNGIIRYVNAAFEKITGYARHEVIGKPARILKSGVHDQAFYRDLWQTILAGRPFHAIFVNRARDGRLYRSDQTIVPARDHTGAITHFVAIGRDVTDRGRAAGLQDLAEHRRFEEQLEYLANHDPSTGLFNRRRFQQELERQLIHTRRSGETGAILLMDLDRFKEINDNLGPRVGDEVLAAVASFLRARFREDGVVARLGGDEFAVLLPRAGEAEAHAAAEELLQGLRQLNPQVAGRGVHVTASLGVALFPRDGSSVDDLLVCADTALRQAKEAGGDRLVVGGRPGTCNGPSRSPLSWERRIRRALENGAFVLYAQPILDLWTGQVSQYELLLRLADEPGPPVLPGEFLAVAERTGLIHAVDRWVIREAIRLVAAHARAGKDLRVEVNLSARAFEDADLLTLIRRQLDESRVRPDSLILEITETATIRDINQARAFVNNLKELGCRFALDDFGVGFGSFYYLKHLPVDYIKIDGSFIRNLRYDPADPHIVRAIVEVAAGLGIRTIAEFVEDDKTLQLLRLYGVDYAQGFHVGRPFPASQLGHGGP